MTTRRGRTWMVIPSPYGPYVARNDSPLAKAARRDRVLTLPFPTIDGAYARLSELRRGRP